MAAMAHDGNNKRADLRAWLARWLVGASPGGERGAADGDPMPDAGDDVVVAVAVEEGVESLVAQRLQHEPFASPMPAALRARFLGLAREQLATELLRRAELQRCLSQLLQAGFRPLLLKGTALAYRLYASPHLRPRCDLDVLFPDVAAVERARGVLEALGYAASGVPTDTLMAHELVFRRQSPAGRVHWIDAHWRLANNALFANRFDFAELEASGVPVPDLDGALALGDLHSLVHACLHRVANLPFGQGDRLIWLYDMHLLAARLDADGWRDLASIAVGRGIAGPVHAGLLAAQAAFATPMPARALEALGTAAEGEAFDMRRAGSRFYQERHNFRNLPPGQRLPWLWQKLFPSAAYVREVHGWQGSTLVGLYLRRLGTGLRLILDGIRR
jgi:hypothetical protein